MPGLGLGTDIVASEYLSLQSMMTGKAGPATCLAELSPNHVPPMLDTAAGPGKQGPNDLIPYT